MRGFILLVCGLAACTSVDGEEENLLVADEDSKADAVSGFGARVWATPYPLQAGIETRLQIRFYHHGERLRSFDSLHTRPLHFIAVSRDHVDFQHLHPTLRSGGTFETYVTFTQDSPYSIALELDPAGTPGPQTVRGTLMGDGASLEGPCEYGCDTWDADGTFVRQHVAEIPTSFDDVEIRRADSLAPFRACEDMQLLYSFRDASGAYQHQFANWLGMPGHAIVFSEDNQHFAHLHGGVSHAGVPGVTFGANLPRAGNYEAFAQFPLGGEVVTVRQWIAVEPALAGTCGGGSGGGTGGTGGTGGGGHH